MLSRTANHLYWMSRYLERAETTTRLLEVGARNALLPNRVLTVAGCTILIE